MSTLRRTVNTVLVPTTRTQIKVFISRTKECFQGFVVFFFFYLHWIYFFFFLVNGSQDEDEEEEEMYELRSLPNGEMSDVSSEPEEGQDVTGEAQVADAEDEGAATVDHHRAIIEDIRWRLVQTVSAAHCWVLHKQRLFQRLLFAKQEKWVWCRCGAERWRPEADEDPTGSTGPQLGPPVHRALQQRLTLCPRTYSGDSGNKGKSIF